METWKACPIPPFHDYAISDEGRIKNRLGKILRPHINRYGYRFVILNHAPEKRIFTVHRLVAAAFIGDVEGRDVHHKDGNRENNLLKNLEILPHKEHMIKQFWPEELAAVSSVRRTNQGKPIETVIEYHRQSDETRIRTTDKRLMLALVGVAEIVEEKRGKRGKLESMAFSFRGELVRRRPKAGQK